MKRSLRPILYLAAALIVAGLVVVIEQPNAPRVDDADTELLAPQLSVENVERIEVRQLLEGAQIKREGEGYLVSTLTTPLEEKIAAQENREATPETWHPGDASRIRSAIGSIVGVAQGVVVSRNPENFRQYRVDDQTGLHVRILDKKDKSIFDGIIGNAGPDFNGTFIRLSGSNDVRLVARPLMGSFSPMTKDWRNRIVLAFPQDTAESIEIVRNKETVRFVRDAEGKWRDHEGKDVAADAMAAYLRMIDPVRADDFPETPPNPTELERMTGSLTVQMQDGSKKTLQLFAADKEGRSLARLEGSTEIVLLSPKTLERLQRGP